MPWHEFPLGDDRRASRRAEHRGNPGQRQKRDGADGHRESDRAAARKSAGAGTEGARHRVPRQLRGGQRPFLRKRSEERRVGKSVSVRVDLGGRSIIKKKQQKKIVKMKGKDSQEQMKPK